MLEPLLHIRPATTADARAIAELLNEIIEKGGTTALTKPVTAEDIVAKMSSPGLRNAWRLAEDDTGRLMGFQWIAPHPDLPEDACDIATFARVGQTGLGVGSKLFDATVRAAHDLGYTWINANIRGDNEGGLAYYQSRGFEDYAVKEGVTLDDGTVVTKRLKRFDLR